MPLAITGWGTTGGRDASDPDRVPLLDRLQVGLGRARRARDEQSVGFLLPGQQNHCAARVVGWFFLYDALRAHQFSQVRPALQFARGELLGLRRRGVPKQGDFLRRHHRHPVLHDDRTPGFDFFPRMVAVQRVVRLRELQNAAVVTILDGQRVVLGKVAGWGGNHAAHDHLLAAIGRRKIRPGAES